LGLRAVFGPQFLQRIDRERGALAPHLPIIHFEAPMLAGTGRSITDGGTEHL
jgi:hypothetical protein